jgi:hypothetical protein
MAKEIKTSKKTAQRITERKKADQKKTMLRNKIGRSA